MRKASFAIALAGISILFAILLFSNPIQINNQEQLNKLLDNSKVQLNGKVIKQTSYSISLDNNITIICKSCPPCKNQDIQATGIIKRYKNDTKIYLSTIKIFNKQK